MWILEADGEALSGRRLWLRPGQRYVIGRTADEAGKLVIKGPGSDKVSRQHAIIYIDNVTKGDGENMDTRSKVTVEDQRSKSGTTVNGEKIRKDSRVLSQDSNVLQLGSFPLKFHITWFPVVLTFSFTGKQMNQNALGQLRDALEPLDIKLLSEYDIQLTTHVVTKNRNSAKGLHALINGKYIVTDGFWEAIVDASRPGIPNSDVTASLLETDFDANWPDAMKFLPPPRDEPVSRLPEIFAPNPKRAEIFDGFTFIFYVKKQYDNLIGPITNGKGKALLKEARPGETQVDDFIRYVKSVAGEKGLGEFEDGSEGKGVVLVRWTTPTSDAEWYAQFFRSISLRLDHRLIDQKEFLDVILTCDTSKLRRPLEFEAEARSSQGRPTEAGGQEQMEVDAQEPAATTNEAPTPPPRPRRAPGRTRAKFKGFAVEISDSDDEAPPPVLPAAPEPPAVSADPPEPSQEGLFVSQEVASQDPEAILRAGRRSQRKRAASPPRASADIMDDFAPTAARLKRRRIAAGEDPIPRQTSAAPPSRGASKSPTPEPETTKGSSAKKKPAGKSATQQHSDILELARKHREEAERRAKEEREQLETAPEDLDLAQIRRLHIEEEMPLRSGGPAVQRRTRDQDVAEGRWEPGWNGRKNFKKFRQRGAVQGRAPERIMIALEEVKTKGFGIGDDYWLEDGDTSQQKKKERRSQTTTETQTQTRKSQTQKKNLGASAIQKKSASLDSAEEEDLDMRDQDRHHDSEDDDDDSDVVAIPAARSLRTGTTTTSQSQARSTPQQQQPKSSSISNRATGTKRPPPAARELPPSKRTRRAVVLPESGEDDDESDDELRFRFGKR
ncbi:hypothetical protein F4778DRAFT_735565 [Xylariomycetidae sp. FL2044]|nr:hypothetical protein F4778DRAFT_735565 [Xylariomycetidae sp. FL2044]